MLIPTHLETYRTTVRPEDCDALGHMNVQHYFRAVSEGMFVVMAQLGLDLQQIAHRQLSFAVVRTEANFRRELHVGEVIALNSTIKRMGEKLVVFHHQLLTVSGDVLAMEVDYDCVLLNLERRRAVPIPDDIRNAALRAFPNLMSE